MKKNSLKTNQGSFIHSFIHSFILSELFTCLFTENIKATLGYHAVWMHSTKYCWDGALWPVPFPFPSLQAQVMHQL